MATPRACSAAIESRIDPANRFTECPVAFAVGNPRAPGASRVPTPLARPRRTHDHSRPRLRRNSGCDMTIDDADHARRCCLTLRICQSAQGGFHCSRGSRQDEVCARGTRAVDQRRDSCCWRHRRENRRASAGGQPVPTLFIPPSTDGCARMSSSMSTPWRVRRRRTSPRHPELASPTASPRLWRTRRAEG